MNGPSARRLSIYKKPNVRCCSPGSARPAWCRTYSSWPTNWKHPSCIRCPPSARSRRIIRGISVSSANSAPRPPRTYWARPTSFSAIGTTWWQPEYVAEDARVIQLDIVREHIGLTFPVDLGIWGDAVRYCKTWWSRLRRAVVRLDSVCAGSTGVIAIGIDPNGTNDRYTAGARRVIAAVGRALVPDAIVSVDVGNNTFWFSRYMQGTELKVLLSGHWRTVGFGLPGAIAAKLAAPRRQVVAISGDGGFGMSMSELMTAVQYQLPIVSIVLSDGRYGEEETLQQSGGQQPFGTGLHNPDWAAYARACGAVGYKAETYEQLQHALHEALPALAAGQISVIDVAVARVDPQHPQPLRGTEQTQVMNGATPEREREPVGARY